MVLQGNESLPSFVLKKVVDTSLDTNGVKFPAGILLESMVIPQCKVIGTIVVIFCSAKYINLCRYSKYTSEDLPSRREFIFVVAPLIIFFSKI